MTIFVIETVWVSFGVKQTRSESGLKAIDLKIKKKLGLRDLYQNVGPWRGDFLQTYFSETMPMVECTGNAEVPTENIKTCFSASLNIIDPSERF